MTMNIGSTWNDSENTLLIDVGDKFNFSAHKQFRDAYVNHESPGMTVKINMRMTNYMDSAALGMLIQLRKFVDSRDGKVVLVHPGDAIMKILKTAHFDRLFAIE